MNDLRNYFVSLLKGPVIISGSDLPIARPINFTAGFSSGCVWFYSFVSTVRHYLGSPCTEREIHVYVGSSGVSGIGLPACKCHYSQ